MRQVLRGLRHSLRTRLLVGTLVWVMVSVLVAGWVLSDLFRQHAARQLASELAVHMNQLVAGLSANEQGDAALTFEPTDPRLLQPLSGLYWQVDRLASARSSAASVLPSDIAVFHSRSLWDQTLHVPARLSIDPSSGLAAFDGGADMGDMLALIRVVAPPEGDARYRLIVAVDQAVLDRPLRQFRIMLAVSLGVLALGLAMAAVMQVVVGLRPLAMLRGRLRAVRDGTKTQIDGDFPSEVQPLVDSFNQVLQNNHQIVQRARTQAGNLAHALKTPLSVLANASAQESSEFGRLVAEQVGVARRHVDHHLARARAAAAVRTPGLRTEVSPVVHGLVRVLSKLYAERGLQISLDDIAPGVAFRGESQDLQEMLGNIMDNACKWASRNIRVTARLMPQGADTMLVLCVEDDGPGLPEARREAAFERGVRLDERVPGSGLGLSIVRDMATAYGGTAEAYASDLGGLGVRLTVPGVALPPTGTIPAVPLG
ncbi:ATP-binding protein [Pusillimonas sp. T2]|uniref:ATP-binding protein n=1 Tax=Pusillimonas sp. T2 TaxID=1548123 RepID=UPI000B9D2DA1|nr:sensor histidine kinase [Pusillimonas sp. T2]OXR48927.1 ATP-binding protein [Pusillimonas sp. T2]